MRPTEPCEGKWFSSTHLQDNWSTSETLKFQAHYLLCLEQNKTDPGLGTRETQKSSNSGPMNYVLKLKGTSEVLWSSLSIISE